MKRKSGFRRVDYHLAVDQWERLKRLSEQTSVSVAAHIRLAVDKYLKSKEKE